jgi:hypothetical protein
MSPRQREEGRRKEGRKEGNKEKHRPIYSTSNKHQATL